MPSSFWSNTIWYILLAVTSAVTMAFALKKSKYRKYTTAFALAILGLLYFLEAILVILFHAYIYLPKIVNDPFQDTVMGNYFSQVSIASTSVLIIVYGLSRVWYVFIAAVYCLIEELFLKLGIYRHDWYRTLYTFIGLMLLFWFVEICYKKITASSKYIARYIPLFLGTFALAGNTIIMPLKVSKLQVFTINIFGNFSKDHTTVSIIYEIILLNLLIILYNRRLYWVWRLAAFAILFLGQYILHRTGIIYFREGWFSFVTVLELIGFYCWIILHDYLLQQKPAASS